MTRKRLFIMYICVLFATLALVLFVRQVRGADERAIYAPLVVHPFEVVTFGPPPWEPAGDNEPHVIDWPAWLVPTPAGVP